MCVHCKMSIENQNNVDVWAQNGCGHTKLNIIKRQTAVTHPNTFVFVFKDANIGNTTNDVYLDVHYQGAALGAGNNIISLGGLWIKGPYGSPKVIGDMKPEQHGNPLRSALYAIVPNLSPSPDDLPGWG